LNSPYVYQNNLYYGRRRAVDSGFVIKWLQDLMEKWKSKQLSKISCQGKRDLQRPCSVTELSCLVTAGLSQWCKMDKEAGSISVTATSDKLHRRY
jgi:hypothetical protein